jgi:hypothetical protein
MMRTMTVVALLASLTPDAQIDKKSVLTISILLSKSTNSQGRPLLDGWIIHELF